MIKRLLLGVVKGVLVGGAVGAAFHFGLGWTVTEGLLGYLIAMGTGSTAGVLAGRPPWQQEAWLEAILKALFGIGTGALLYWLGSSFAAVELPFSLAGAPEGKAWTALPLLYAPVVAAVFGAVVELDNTGDEGGRGNGGKNTPKTKDKDARISVPRLEGLDSDRGPAKPNASGRTG